MWVGEYADHDAGVRLDMRQLPRPLWWALTSGRGRFAHRTVFPRDMTRRGRRAPGGFVTPKVASRTWSVKNGTERVIFATSSKFADLAKMILRGSKKTHEEGQK